MSILQQPHSTGDVPVVAGGLEQEYEVEKAIGKGGYAVVYKGRRKKDGLVVAIKRVEIAEMAPKKRERCIKEVHLLQQLNHPHIIKFHDAFVDQNQSLIIITEWAPGGDLKKLIRRMAEAGRRFEEPEIWHYFLQVVDGLRGMHAARILHRDMKPANVLVCASGVLKLGDLGLGRKLGPQTVDVMSKVGTPYYCSPEVVKGVKYSFLSDMWSTGCLLYELAMLKSPFETEGANLYDVFQKISKGDFQPLPADRFSPALRSLVSSLLAQDPQARPTAEQVWQQGQVLLQAQQQPQQPQPQQLQQCQQQGCFRTHQQDTSGLVDACMTSEHVVAMLHIIASEAQPRAASSSTKLSKSPSKRSRGGAAAAASGPQLELLKQLHPLIFAQPLSAFGTSRLAGSGLPQVLQEEQLQQLQLGLVVQLCAWLVRLMGKLDAAQSLEAELTAPRSAGSSGTSSRTLPMCRDCLRAAEVVRKAAQSAGVQGLDAAPAAELVVGHGRAVCWLLQALADATFTHLKLACRRCSHASDAAAACIEELHDDDADAHADVAAAAADDARAMSDDFNQGSAADLGVDTAQQQACVNYNLQPSGQGGSVDVASRQQQQPVVAGLQTVIRNQVDGLAWRAETERLAPQLARIHLPAASQAAAVGLDQQWHSRWQATRQLQQQLGELVGQVQLSLLAVQQGVAGDLQRLLQMEQRLNQELEVPLGNFAELRRLVEGVQQQRQQNEDVIQSDQQQLHQIASRLEEVQQQIADRTGQLQNSVILQRHRTAVKSLKNEIQQMELRLGLLMHELTKCKEALPYGQVQLQLASSSAKR